MTTARLRVFRITRAGVSQWVVPFWLLVPDGPQSDAMIFKTSSSAYDFAREWSDLIMAPRLLEDGDSPDGWQRAASARQSGANGARRQSGGREQREPHDDH